MLIRQFAIPNPFEALGEGIIISLGDVPFTLTPEILNWIADPIIFSVTFGIVGLYYRKGSAPALGSFLYMLFYCVHIGLLYWVLSMYPTVWQMVLIGCLYVALHISALIIKCRRFLKSTIKNYEV